MDLAVFGANGPTGRLVVRQALAAGHHITAVTRKPDTYPLHAPRLDVVAADVADPDAVARALAGAHAVISTFGVPYGRKPITVYSRGVFNIARAMADQGIARLVCVSSTTVATGDAPGESLFWRKALIPLVRHVIGRTVYDDMERMEEVVQQSDLDWTIVRRAGLFDADAPTADYGVSTRRLLGRLTSRAHLAETLIREAITPQHARQIIEVITRSGLPSSTAFLRKTFGREE